MNQIVSHHRLPSASRSAFGWAGTGHWSAPLAASRGASPETPPALEDLCSTYWYVLYAYVRRHGYEVEEAQDLTQGFFARLLESHWLEQANPTRGKFRSFLMASFNHFLANEWRKSHAAKRGGGRTNLSLDDTAEKRYAPEPASNLSPDKVFERNWLHDRFEVALSRLRSDYYEVGKEKAFDLLKVYLTGEVEDGDYARLSAELGISQGAAATAVCRLRHRYRELVREEIGRTVSNPREIDEELRGLLHSLA